MDYKSLLLHVAPGAADAPYVATAAQIARQFGAHLSAVCAEAFDPHRDPRLTHLDGLQLQALRDGLQQEAAAARTQFEAMTAGLSIDWRTILHDPDDTLVRHAAGSDLIVAERPLPRQDRRRFAEPDDLILESGLPVLVLPPRQTEFDARHVVVGWKPTRESNRVLGDALPFLVRAEAVSVVAVRHRDEHADAEAELADVTARLARHGVRAQAVVRDVSLAPAAEVLMEFAMAHGAGLVVVGAYGHSRLRQWILGGVTRTLLETAWKPVLFGH